MRVIRHASLVAAPWKNGGGSTTTIAVFPDGATLDDFEWRLSLATIDRDGPFSSFPGVDRTLALVEGGIELDVDGARAALDEGQQVAFAGEQAVYARLRDGSTTDFNVMTRRRVYRHTLERVRVKGRASIAATIVFVVEGTATIEGGERFELARWDAVVLDQACVVDAVDAVLLVTTLTRASSSPTFVPPRLS